MRQTVTEYGGYTSNCSQGEVLLFPRGVAGYVVGQLLELSDSGFRVWHDCESLPPGCDVGFKHRFAQGIASVVWTSRSMGRIECRCVVKPGEPSLEINP